MPAKRRLAKARSLATSDAAKARWTKVGGIEISKTGSGIITDPELAALLGRFPLVAYPDLKMILDNLRSEKDEP